MILSSAMAPAADPTELGVPEASSALLGAIDAGEFRSTADVSIARAQGRFSGAGDWAWKAATDRANEWASRDNNLLSTDVKSAKATAQAYFAPLVVDTSKFSAIGAGAPRDTMAVRLAKAEVQQAINEYQAQAFTPAEGKRAVTVREAHRIMFDSKEGTVTKFLQSLEDAIPTNTTQRDQYLNRRGWRSLLPRNVRQSVTTTLPPEAAAGVPANMTVIGGQ